MASANIGGGSSGRKKTLDAEVNLVPFIDLLSMCICFLLMTAVWTQLSSVQVKQANGTEGAESSKTSLDLDVKFMSDQVLALTLKSSGKTMKSFETDLATLDTQIRSIQASLAQGSEISAVMLTPKAGVDYGTMVNVMDILRKNKLVNLGVIPVSPTHAGAE